LLPSQAWLALSIRLNVSLPGVEREVAQALLEAAHKICPYSKASRGNIDVATTGLKKHFVETWECEGASLNWLRRLGTQLSQQFSGRCHATAGERAKDKISTIFTHYAPSKEGIMAWTGVAFALYHDHQSTRDQRSDRYQCRADRDIGDHSQ
jgi:hypothetical protein